ncbi:MAG TPA: hypothetical protein DCL31_10635 [Clostridium sp.]|nr:hypothetical protein [Clostridium sp.]
MINWVLIVLFISIIFKEFKILKELVITTKKNLVEKIFFLIGSGAIIYITYAYARTWMHYLLGILGIILYVIDYFKSGITSNGFASVYRGLQFISWNKIQEVHINKGKNIKVSYSGDGFHHSLYFEIKDYDKIVEFLNEKLPNELVDVDCNFYIKK